MVEQTSLEAYYSITKDLSKRESLVMDVLRRYGGKATAWTIIDFLGMNNPNKVRPRLTDLYNKGMIVKAGVKYNDIYNCNETVWKIVS